MESPTAVIYEGERPLLVHQAALVKVISGPDKGRSCKLRQQRVRVGTAPDAELVLTDTHVSRRHLEFRVQDHGYLVRDMGSTNGTFYRGARIQEAELGAGAEIRLGKTVLRLEVGEVTSEEVRPQQGFGSLIGVSSAMQEIYGLLEAVAPTDATVLIEGESGTGKEVVAEALHRGSPRADKLFYVVDCGSIPSSLIESELFGHERGAFTGADRSREGAFERARGGTVFLDEIGELSLELQPRLLRVLDRREVKRVGSDLSHKVDVRLVAATNRNLKELVQQGLFREDLYFRLAVIKIFLPPLRERRKDIPLLAKHFLWQAGCVDVDAVLTGELLQLLMSRQWRGNARELRNTIERAVVMSDGGLLNLPKEEALPMPADRPGDVEQPPESDDNWLARALPAGFLQRSYKEAKEELVNNFEALYLSRLISDYGFNLSQIARDAGVDRQIIRRMLRKHGLT